MRHCVGCIAEPTHGCPSASTFQGEISSAWPNRCSSSDDSDLNTQQGASLWKWLDGLAATRSESAQRDGQHMRHSVCCNGVRQPNWIMDQLYIILASLFFVIRPLALLRVKQRANMPDHLRTVRDPGRFVRQFTPDILELAQRIMPESFLENAAPHMLEVSKVFQLLWAVLVAAQTGTPISPGRLFRFGWGRFRLSFSEYQGCCTDAIGGFLIAMTYSMHTDLELKVLLHLPCSNH